MAPGQSNEAACKLYNMQKYRPACSIIDSCTKKVRENYCWPSEGYLIPFAKPCRCIPPQCTCSIPYTVPNPLKRRRPPIFRWKCGIPHPVYAFVPYPKENKAAQFGATNMKFVPLDTVACLRNKAKADALYSAMWKFPKCQNTITTCAPRCYSSPTKYSCKLAFPDARPCPFCPMNIDEAERRGLCHPCPCC